jgi:hypothetical protein
VRASPPAHSFLSSLLTESAAHWQESVPHGDSPPDTVLDDDRLLTTLQQVLQIYAPELRPALDHASSLVNAELGADKVDLFLYAAETTSLVALAPATPRWATANRRSVWTGCR